MKYLIVLCLVFIFSCKNKNVKDFDFILKNNTQINDSINKLKYYNEKLGVIYLDKDLNNSIITIEIVSNLPLTLSRNIKTDFIKINNFPFIIYSEYSEQLNISNKDSEKIKKELLKKGLVNFNNTGLLTDYFYWKFYYCSNNPSKMVCYGKHQIEKLQHDSMKSMDSDNFKPFEESNFYQECD